jgi:hypothetical protein
MSYRWQTKWIQGKPRYVLNAPQDVSNGDQPVSISLYDGDSYLNFILELEVASTANLKTANEAGIVVIIQYTDESNFTYLKLSSAERSGGLFQVLDGDTTLLESMTMPFLQSHLIEPVQIVVENNTVEVWKENQQYFSSALPSGFTLNKIGFGAITGGAAFSDFSVEEIMELRQTQTLNLPNLTSLNIGESQVSFASLVSGAGLPVSVEVLSGAAVVDDLGNLILSGLGTIELRFSQGGNDQFTPAPSQRLSLSISGGTLSYEQWAVEFDLPTDKHFDSNLDGFPNVVSFALGFDPFEVIDGGLIEIELKEQSLAGTLVELAYTESTTADAYLQLQRSSDGKTWIEVNDAVDGFESIMRNPIDGKNQNFVIISLRESFDVLTRYRLLIEGQ